MYVTNLNGLCLENYRNYLNYYIHSQACRIHETEVYRGLSAKQKREQVEYCLSHQKRIRWCQIGEVRLHVHNLERRCTGNSQKQVEKKWCALVFQHIQGFLYLVSGRQCYMNVVISKHHDIIIWYHHGTATVFLRTCCSCCSWVLKIQTATVTL